MKQGKVLVAGCFMMASFLFSRHKQVVGRPHPMRPTTSVTVPVDWLQEQSLLTQVPSDIAYFIIDLKYSPERGVTIIEFGNGLKAGYKVLDHTVGRGFIYKLFWERLSSYRLPMWYVGSTPRSQAMSAWQDYINHGGYHVRNLVDLVSNINFKKDLSSDAPFKQGAMVDKKGVVVVRKLKRSSLRQKRFMQDYGNDVIIVNRAIAQYMGDKRLTNLLFNDDFLKAFRPRSQVYPRNYTPELAAQIMSDLDCEWFVIKPVRSTQGNGVLMVHKDDLDDVLKKILKQFHNNMPCDNNFLFARYSPLVMQYWKHDRNSHFLVEEYVESSPITYQKKHYDATMRVIVFMHYDKGQMRLEFAGEYWKRPLKSLESDASFREKRLSKHAPNYIQSLGGQVGQDDRQGVYQGLIAVLPRIYGNILIDYFVTRDYISQVQTPVDQALRAKKTARAMKAKKSLYRAGRRKYMLFNS